jgi:DNA-binding response OmpR family regulator
MRIFVFEEDASLLNLLTLYLEIKGHQVRGFTDQYSCPLYQSAASVCPADKPCADAVIVNTRCPDQENIQILIDQERKGCKLPGLNKAVISANISEEQDQMICSLGFYVIRKPFRLTTISSWLTECAKRLNKL